MAELPHTVALPTLITDEDGLAPPPVGGTIDRAALPPHIELRQLAGVGGMGEVWRAFDHQRGQPIAVKQPRGGSLTEAIALRSEFRRAQAIHHPNLVALYELFVRGESSAFTMEWIDGAPLSPNQEAPALRRRLRGVLDGLEALHHAGLVHGDVKPSNVMVAAPTGENTEERVILLDFGLMRQAGTAVPGYAGTLEYMAPELLLRQVATPATDLYALGVLLYQSLTGRVPVGGDAERQRMHKMGQWFEPPAVLRPDCPADLSALCMALLSPEPEERPRLEAARQALRSDEEPETNRLRAPSRRWVPRPALEWSLIEATRPSTENIKLVGIFGAAGMGKTALLDRVARRSGLDQQLRAACSVAERVAFPGLDGLVDQLVPLLSAELRRGRPPSARALEAAGALFPVLIGGAPRAVAPNATERAAAVDALALVLRRLGGLSPLLIVLEDLQWAGPDTSALLQRLLPQLGPGCVVVLSAEGPEAIEAAVGRAPWARIAVGPLSEAEVRGALGGLSPALQQLSRDEGLPPYAIALAAALRAADAAEGDDPWLGLAALAARLGPQAARVVQLCALSEGPLPLRLLAPLGAAETGARAAAYAGLLRVQASAEGPQLSLAIGAARAHLTPAGAALLREHALMGDVLDKDGEASAAQAAHHLQRAGQPERARAAHLRAGRWALRSGATGQAVVQLAAARALGASVAELGEDYGQALAFEGDIAGAAAVWLEAAEAIGGADRIKLRGWAGGLLLGTGQLSEGVAVYDALMADLGMKALPGNLGALWGVARGTSVPTAQAGLPAPSAEVSATLEAMWALGLALARHELLTGFAALERHRRLAYAVDSPKHQLLALTACVWGGELLRLPRAEVEAQLSALIPKVDDLATLGTVHGARVLRALTDGDLRVAAESAAQATAHFGPELYRSWIGRAVAVDALNVQVWQVNQSAHKRSALALVEACRLAGDRNQALMADLSVAVRATLICDGLAAAEARLARALEAYGRPVGVQGAWRLRTLRAELRLFAGDIDGVHASYRDVPWSERPFSRFPLSAAQLHWLCGQAELLRPTGVAESAVLARSIKALEAIPNRIGQGFARRLRAVQRAHRGELQAAAADDAEAITLLNSHGFPLTALLIERGSAGWPQTGAVELPGVVDFVIGRDPRRPRV